eukprot:scaffold2998_cov158-Ochromonas_danica.AAC.1
MEWSPGSGLSKFEICLNLLLAATIPIQPNPTQPIPYHIIPYHPISSHSHWKIMQRSAGKKKSEGGPSDEAPERNGEEEEDEIEAEAEAVEDQFEAALAARGGGGGDTWQAGGARKDVVIRILVQCFASMVESLPREDAIPDYKGRYRSEDLVHVKLLDANKQVVKAK